MILNRGNVLKGDKQGRVQWGQPQASLSESVAIKKKEEEGVYADRKIHDAIREKNYSVVLYIKWDSIF